MALTIRQQDNFTQNFGLVLRSSAIFYYRRDRALSTTISLLNYWSLKRGLTVAIVASLRDMTGRLIRRERLAFTPGMVVNYAPDPGADAFEGSVEIEAFSTDNLVIPYAAVMAVYRTAHGVSMVHSYARTYAPHEIEEGRTITEGEESCWTIRDDARTRSFAVFHNGGHAHPPQTLSLTVTNLAGERRTVQVALPLLRPYETVVIRPAEQIAGLAEWLGGRPGNASLSFSLTDAFTRMLVGNEALDGSDWQVTHSNFNYSRHTTDRVTGRDPRAYMVLPRLEGARTEVVVYPDGDPGQYEVSSERMAPVAFEPGRIVEIGEPASDTPLVFTKRGDALPTRIVTGLRVSRAATRLPAECSLGVVHRQRPPKRFWWGLCAAGPDLQSRLVITELTELLGPPPAEAPITLRLYSARRPESLTALLADGSPLVAGLLLTEIFPEATEFLGGEPGWFTFVCDYPGYMVYSTLERDGSVTLEHGF